MLLPTAPALGAVFRFEAIDVGAEADALVFFRVVVFFVVSVIGLFLLLIPNRPFSSAGWMSRAIEMATFL